MLAGIKHGLNEVKKKKMPGSYMNAWRGPVQIAKEDPRKNRNL